MSEFVVFFKLGFGHITDFAGYDHMLFLLALCLPFLQGKTLNILWPVSAFTLGHSATLVICLTGVQVIPAAWVEFLIPLTIIATAYSQKNTNKNSLPRWSSFWMASGFGLIHGLGFSNYLRYLLPPDTALWSRLLAFNIGIEAGQVFFLAVVMGILLLAFRFSPASIKPVSSGMRILIIGISLYLAISTLPL